MAIPAFIFARGGSKGLPNKNILDFCGKPLIAWSIQQALEVEEIDRVIVSTDSIAIAQIAEHYGAEVPFLRPKDLAADNSSEILSWKHALDYEKISSGSYPEVFLSVPATAPLRQVKDLEKCLEKFRKSDIDILITVTESPKNPFFNVVKIDRTGLVSKLMQSDEQVFRRQDAPAAYDITSVCYVAKPSYILKANNIFDGKVSAYEVPAERAIDIDSKLDLEFAEHILKGMLKNQMP